MCHVLRKTPRELNELIDRKLAGNQLFSKILFIWRNIGRIRVSEDFPNVL